MVTDDELKNKISRMGVEVSSRLDKLATEETERRLGSYLGFSEAFTASMFALGTMMIVALFSVFSGAQERSDYLIFVFAGIVWAAVYFYIKQRHDAWFAFQRRALERLISEWEDEQ